MPNKNYVKGRAWEYKVAQRWQGGGVYKTMRASGSHSPFDIVAYTSDLSQVQFLKKGATRELTSKYEYKTELVPIVGYGIQCKMKKRRVVRKP